MNLAALCRICRQGRICRLPGRLQSGGDRRAFSANQRSLLMNQRRLLTNVRPGVK
jgi:hypothetical protein